MCVVKKILTAYLTSLSTYSMIGNRIMNVFSPEVRRSIPIAALALVAALPLQGCEVRSAYGDNSITTPTPTPEVKAPSAVNFLNEFSPATILNNGYPVNVVTHEQILLPNNKKTPATELVQLESFRPSRPSYYGVEINKLDMRIVPPTYDQSGQLVVGSAFSESLIALGNGKAADDLGSFSMSLRFASADIMAKVFDVDPALSKYTVLALNIRNFSEHYAVTNAGAKQTSIPLVAISPDGQIIPFLRNLEAGVDSKTGERHINAAKLRLVRSGSHIIIATGEGATMDYTQFILDGRFDIDEVAEPTVKVLVSDADFSANSITALK